MGFTTSKSQELIFMKYWDTSLTTHKLLLHTLLWLVDNARDVDVIGMDIFYVIRVWEVDF